MKPGNSASDKLSVVCIEQVSDIQSSTHSSFIEATEDTQSDLIFCTFLFYGLL